MLRTGQWTVYNNVVYKIYNLENNINTWSFSFWLYYYLPLKRSKSFASFLLIVVIVHLVYGSMEIDGRMPVCAERNRGTNGGGLFEHRPGITFWVINFEAYQIFPVRLSITSLFGLPPPPPSPWRSIASASSCPYQQIKFDQRVMLLSVPREGRNDRFRSMSRQ